MNGATEDQGTEDVSLELSVRDEVDHTGQGVPAAAHDERQQRDEGSRHHGAGVGDHAGEAAQDSEGEKEWNAVNGQKRGGQRGIEGANERQPAEIAADRLVHLLQHVPIQVARFGARLVQGGTDQASPEDQHEHHQEQDRHGSSRKAERAAHRGQDGGGCALQHRGEALLELLDVISQVKTSVEAAEEAAGAGGVNEGGGLVNQRLALGDGRRDERESEPDQEPSQRHTHQSDRERPLETTPHQHLHAVIHGDRQQQGRIGQRDRHQRVDDGHHQGDHDQDTEADREYRLQRHPRRLYLRIGLGKVCCHISPRAIAASPQPVDASPTRVAEDGPTHPAPRALIASRDNSMPARI